MTYPAQNSSPSPGGSPWRLPQLRHTVAIPLVTLLLAATVGKLLVLTPQVTTGETALLEGLTHYRNAVFDALATLIHVGLSPWLVVVLIAAGTGWLAVRHRPYDAAGFLLVSLSGWAAVGLVKAAVERPRPALGGTEPLLHVDGFTSFPSGHTGAALAIVIALTVITRDRTARHRILGYGLLAVMLVGACRVYAGAHYPLDALCALPVAWAGTMVGCTVANTLVPALGYGFGWRQAGVPAVRLRPAVELDDAAVAASGAAPTGAPEEGAVPSAPAAEDTRRTAGAYAASAGRSAEPAAATAQSARQSRWWDEDRAA